jgi:hypothetical protein
MNTNRHFWTYLAQFFLEWEMFHINVVQEINTNLSCSIILCTKIAHLRDKVEKCCTAGQATVDSTALARFSLGTYGYKHTLSENVILIVFRRQQWLQDRASMLRHTYTVCLVMLCYVMPTQRAKDIHTITAQSNITLNILFICTFIYQKNTNLVS